MDKKTLRIIYRNKRKELLDEQVSDYSVKMGEVLGDSELVNGLNIGHLFTPIAKNKEPDCWLIKQQLSSSINWCTGIVNGTTMKHVSLTDSTEFQENEWGIPEPINGEEIKPTELDFVLVPLLICDKKGNRVGYGKGFYDGFLRSCKPNCLFIGVSFFEPLDETISADAWDIPLDYCLTPQSLHTFTAAKHERK